MSKQYSVAEARNRLPTLIREVEKGKPAEITRRGRPVAVVLSFERYERLHASRPGFGDAYQAWRSTIAPDDVSLPPAFFGLLRDRSRGRRVRV
jgi:prevent-host-death family protein